MIKTTINLDNIESIVLIDKKEHNTIQWRLSERKVWNWGRLKFDTIQVCGYYDSMLDALVYDLTEEQKYKLHLSLPELKEQHPELIIEHGIVYRRPKVKITLKSGEIKTKEFSNLNEADLYYQALNRKLTNKIEL